MKFGVAGRSETLPTLVAGEETLCSHKVTPAYRGGGAKGGEKAGGRRAMIEKLEVGCWYKKKGR